MRANRQKAAVVIATDGEPTDGNLFEAIKPLTKLPVSIIVRLCTDEQSVVDYWNKIEKDFELTLEVIDDYQTEAKEIHNYNPWLTYGYPMHELRGFGVYSKSFDLLDEQKLSSRQMIEVSTEMYIYNLLTFFFLFFSFINLFSILNSTNFKIIQFMFICINLHIIFTPKYFSLSSFIL